MSRELIGRKQSSTISARAAYELLVENGYRPRLANPEKPLHSLNWSAVIHDQNVVFSNSGKSIHMIDASGQNRIMVDLKIKGMMSESSVAFLQQRTDTRMKPSP